MNSFKWKIYCGSKFINAGTIEGECQRDAMGEVLLAQDGELDADKSYSVTVGDATMSTYGDECRESARVNGYGDDAEKEILDGGYIFKPKVAKGMIQASVSDAIKNLTKVRPGEATKALRGILKTAMCQKHMDGEHRWHVPFPTKDPCIETCPCGEIRTQHEMNDTVVNPTTGEHHAKCRQCGFLEPRGMDEIIGTALEGGKKGEIILVKLNSGSHISAKCGVEIVVNERLRMGASGVIYPLAPDGIIKVTNGKWTDPFTNAQLNTIRKIVTLQGMDSYLIEGVVRELFMYKFLLSDGRSMMISDEMIAQFRG